VEFALSAAILVPCFTGSFQFGYGIYTYNRLQASVSNGARYGGYRTYRSLNGQTDIDKGKDVIRNVVVYGTVQPSPDTKPIIQGLTTAKVNVSYTLGATSEPIAVKVSISSFTLDAVFTTFTFTGKPLATFPYLGRYAPEEAEP
jgi:Flp pilus assembly protein TadG